MNIVNSLKITEEAEFTLHTPPMIFPPAFIFFQTDNDSRCPWLESWFSTSTHGSWFSAL